MIGLLKGKQVVAIDSNQDELIEAADGPLKIIMDATRLEFLDDSFNLVTAFYFQGYKNLYRNYNRQDFRIYPCPP